MHRKNHQFIMEESCGSRAALRRLEAKKKIEYLKTECRFSGCIINLQENSEAINEINFSGDNLTIYAAGPMTFLAEIAKRNLLPDDSNIIFKGMMFTRNPKENIFGDNFNLIVDPIAAEVVITQLFPKCSTIQCFPTELFKGNHVNWASFQKSQMEKISHDAEFAKQCGLTSEIADLILLYNIGTGNSKLSSSIGVNSEMLTKPVFDLALAMPISEAVTSKVTINIVDNPEVYGGKRFEVVEDESGQSKIQIASIEKLNLDITQPGAILDVFLSINEKQVSGKSFQSSHWMRLHQPSSNPTDTINQIEQAESRNSNKSNNSTI